MTVMPRRRGAQFREMARRKPTVSQWPAASRRSGVPVLCGRDGCGRRLGVVDVADLAGMHARALLTNGAVVQGADPLPSLGPARQFRCRLHGSFPAISEPRLYLLWIEARMPTIIGETAKPIVLR